MVAETWVRSPETACREYSGVHLRSGFAGTRTMSPGATRSRRPQTAPRRNCPSRALRQEWDLVLAGAYEGDFAALLDARFASPLRFGIESV